MRLHITFTILFLSCFYGHGQTTLEHTPIKTENSKVTLAKTTTAQKTTPKNLKIKAVKIVRLHKNKNNRIIKALAFDIIANKPKMA